MQQAVIYCRVSTEEQAEKGYSLDAQEKFCTNFAKSNGCKVVAVYRDEGKSATSLNRPALQEMLSKCQQDKSINALLVQETDRLARNTKDHLTIKALLKKADVKLISVAQPMLDDSPEGMMIDTILASVNQFQSDINGRKVKKGMQQRFDEGWYPGLAPLGYINAPAPGCSTERRAKKIIAKDPDKWGLMRQAFDLYLSGDYSVMEINDILYKKGLRSVTGKKVPKSVMTRLIQNPFYAGILQWNGQEKIGRHLPMITMSEHKRILQVLDAHNLHACRRRKHSFLLRGFIFCNICGQRYTAEKHPKKKKNYYHCVDTIKKHSNRGQMIEHFDLEKLVEAEFKKIQFSKEFTDRILSKLKAVYYAQKETIDAKKQTLHNQKQAIELKRDKAEEKLLNGVISDDAFVRLRDKFRSELSSIQTQLFELESQKEMDIDSVHEIIKLTHNSYEVYKTAPYELKRQYLGLFWDKFLVQDKKIIKAVPTKFIQILQREKAVIISTEWCPSPNFIKLFCWNFEYWASMKVRLKKIRH